jgi:hypothetical protein
MQVVRTDCVHTEAQAPLSEKWSVVQRQTLSSA